MGLAACAQGALLHADHITGSRNIVSARVVVDQADQVSTPSGEIARRQVRAIIQLQDCRLDLCLRRFANVRFAVDNAGHGFDRNAR